MERTIFQTPNGEAKYPYIFEPDKAFGSEKYKTSLVINEKDAKPLVEKIKETWVKENGKDSLGQAKMPWKTLDDGSFIFNMSTKLPPRVFDTSGNLIKENLHLRSGSTLQVRGTIGTYSAGGSKGCSLYMNNVLVVNPVTASEAESPFAKDGEGFVYEKADDDASNDSTEDANKGDF